MRLGAWFLWTIGVLLPATAAAQPFGGYEASLHGPRELERGRPNLLYGRVFEVRGVARLRPWPGGSVQARWVGRASGAPRGAWAPAQADGGGHFQLAVEVPADATNPSMIELQIGQGARARTLQLPVRVTPAEELLLRTDRRFYEPGETIHVWALVRDGRTGAPIPGRAVRLRGLRGSELPPLEANVQTDDSGVAYARFRLAADEPADEVRVVATSSTVQQQGVSVNVGQRTQERVLAELRWPETTVAPGAVFHPKVEVRSATGAPIADAEVELRVGEAPALTGRTDEEGMARFEAQAPTFVSGQVGAVSVAARAVHEAHGAAEVVRPLQLATPWTLSIEGIARGGALIPGLPSTLYVRLADAASDPPPAGTVVTVRGPGLRRPVRRRTDEHGLVELDVRLARADAATHFGGPCAGVAAASFEVRVEGSGEQVARVCVPVDVEAPARAEARQAVVKPGEEVRVDVRRRPDARGKAVLVALTRHEQILSVQVTRGDEVAFEAPRVLGVLQIMTRTLGDPERDENAASVAAVEPILVRPAAPDFPTARSLAPVYEIGGDAEVEVHTTPGAPHGWLAMDVRDLAQHGGERPFEARFLRDRVREAVLRPDTPSLLRLARASLASLVQPPPAPEPVAPFLDRWGHWDPLEWNGPAPGLDLRDPIAAGHELVRRNLVRTFAKLEAAVDEADTLAPLTEGDGAARRFRDDVPTRIGTPDTTLGGLPLTIAALRDADPDFGFDAVARRVSRRRLVRALVVLLDLLRQREDAAPPPTRWASWLIREGRVPLRDLRDPWGGTLGVRRRPSGVLAVSAEAPDWTLAFPGPDGRLGTADDIVDPCGRAAKAGSLYAVYSGEDALMRALALVAPAEETLAAMLDAYARMTRAQQEALEGDAVSADATEGLGGEGGLVSSAESYGLGSIGHGYGGGGAGFGSGVARAGSGMPVVRAGSAAIQPPGSLRSLVREEFPGTLRFEPSIPVSETGTTAVRIPLGHAATTYLVEFVHWREDGWVWSTSTRIRAERALMVDAPIPRFATEGDELSVPVRVSSRAPGRATLTLAAEGDLTLTSPPAPMTVEVAPGEASVRFADVAPTEGRGHLRVEARTSSGRDAVRRPLTVLADGRPTTVEAERWIEGRGTLVLEVPIGARRRDGGTLVLSTAPALLGSDDAAWSAWARALRGEPRAADVRAAAAVIAGQRDDEGELRLRQPLATARALAIAWRDARALPDEDVEALLVALTQALGDHVPSVRATERSALVLLALAPALRHRAARAGGETLQQLATTLRALVETGAASRSDAPALQAAAAAALAWIGAAEARVDEHLRRAERGLVRFDEEVWLHGRTETLSSQNWAPTALLALAYLGRGDRSSAFPLLRTMAARTRRSTPPTDAGLAGAAARLLPAGPLERVAIELDGERRTVRLRGGSARLALPSWDRPGHHQVRLHLAPGHALHLHATASIAVPWRRTAPNRTAVELDLARADERPPRLGRYAEWELTVHNHRPRTVRETIVELTLPAGAELDEGAMARLRPWLRERPSRSQQTLRLRLRPLLPGRSIRLPLRLRMSVAGKLRGLGVAAYPADRPDDVAVLEPRRVEVSR